MQQSSKAATFHYTYIYNQISPNQVIPPLAQLSLWRHLLSSQKHTTPIPIALSPNPQPNPQKLLNNLILIINFNKFCGNYRHKLAAGN